jgi:hypothetical protein
MKVLLKIILTLNIVACVLFYYEIDTAFEQIESKVESDEVYEKKLLGIISKINSGEINPKLEKIFHKALITDAGVHIYLGKQVLESKKVFNFSLIIVAFNSVLLCLFLFKSRKSNV